MKNKLLICFLIMLILGITFFILVKPVKAETYKLDSLVNLVQTCNNCTFCNVSKIIYPNGTIFLTNLQMTQDSNSYNYILTNNYTGILGEYNWWYICGNSVEIATGKLTFSITATGKELTSSKSITYILIFIISFIVLIVLLIVGIALPVKNNTDELKGYIVSISLLKYFKIFCLGLAYLMALFISYMAYIMAYSFLDMDFITNIFRTIYTILLILVLPLFIFLMYFTIVKWIDDSKIADMLSRGLHING